MLNNDTINEIEFLGGNTTNPIWLWLLRNGPHGKDFTWGQTKNEPPGYVGVEHLERIVREKSSIDSSFNSEAKKVMRIALKSNNTNILIRAIQIGAVIGSESDLIIISALTKHQNDVVISNARASVFYLKKRLKVVNTVVIWQSLTSHCS